MCVKILHEPIPFKVFAAKYREEIWEIAVK